MIFLYSIHCPACEAPAGSSCVGAMITDVHEERMNALAANPARLFQAADVEIQAAGIYEPAERLAILTRLLTTIEASSCKNVRKFQSAFRDYERSLNAEASST